MKLIAPLLCSVAALLPAAAQAEADTRVYEMRVYYAAPGKLDALNKRFRDHTLKLFEKHGITNVGYFVPLDNKEQKLVYFLSYPTRAAREASWKSFVNDPAWKKAQKASEVDGKLVAKVVSVFMQTTDYSPPLKIEKAGPRVFELRTYTATKDNLDDLNARFRNHTVKLFEKHGMTNVVYWNYMADQKNADKMLVYLLAHKDQAAAKASYGAFREDADWVKARTASEEKAGGSLTEKEKGVVSEFLAPTDYSPLR
ncbi:MAG: NIPSNAP family protein [Planctomycetaceae bacterium]|nr:NIPSNAP family protein [Planctomycetaceae bacterium]